MFQISINIFTLVYVILGSGIISVLVWNWYKNRSTTTSSTDSDDASGGDTRWFFMRWLYPTTTATTTTTASVEDSYNITSNNIINEMPPWVKKIANAAGGTFMGKEIIPKPMPPSPVVVADVSDNTPPQPQIITSNDTKKISSFQRLGHGVLSDLIKESGGDCEKNLKPNVRIEFKGRKLEFDSYYDDGNTKIAVEWQGMHHLVYPNHVHRTVSDFNDLQESDSIKTEMAKKFGIVLISVPYTVDRCVVDDTEPTGYRFDQSIPIEQRKQSIHKFLIVSLLESYKN